MRSPERGADDDMLALGECYQLLYKEFEKDDCVDEPLILDD